VEPAVKRNGWRNPNTPPHPPLARKCGGADTPHLVHGKRNHESVQQFLWGSILCHDEQHTWHSEHKDGARCAWGGGRTSSAVGFCGCRRSPLPEVPTRASGLTVNTLPDALKSLYVCFSLPAKEALLGHNGDGQGPAAAGGARSHVFRAASSGGPFYLHHPQSPSIDKQGRPPCMLSRAQLTTSPTILLHLNRCIIIIHEILYSL
jgi:hypothetical protein